MTDERLAESSQEGDAAGSTGYGPFAYLSTPNAPIYRRVMRALMTEKERFTVHMRSEGVLLALRSDGGAPVDEDAVTDALERLARPAWGNLHDFPDASRVTALEDFYRRRMLYQLSREGEAAERALAQYDAALGTRGALQSVALEDIVVLLTQLRNSIAERDSGRPVDSAAIHQALRALHDRFSELAENAVAFMGSMQRTIDLHDADVDAFLAYKEQLIEYLERFIRDLLTRGAAIAALLLDIPASAVVSLAEIAAERESVDAAPGEAERAFDLARDRWLTQWSGLEGWFISSSQRESEAKLLRARARAAIPALLAVVRALHERTGGRTDRSQDFLALATWFAALPTDGDRHRLWRSAFGLVSVRHWSVTTETERAWADASLGNATPWSVAPPLQISPQLRRSGTYERRGKPSRVIDRTAAKAMLAAQAAAENEQTAAARRRVLTDGPRPLSAFGELDSEAFHLFLGLLGDALVAMVPQAEESTVHTSDGELRVTLTRLPGAPAMTLVTSGGVFTGPDHLVDIAPASGASGDGANR